jgi:hypothetical protein
MNHYHISWSGKKEVDWERFQTREEADAGAKQLVRPGERYTIEQFDEDCPWCHALLAKPVSVADIIELIHKKLSDPSIRTAMKKERVAEILERDADSTIQNWLWRVECNKELTTLSLNYQERAGHLPLLLGDLVRRLRLASNASVPNSSAAREHGILRRKQGYTIAMVVEESRNLQVSIFSTLQRNLGTVDFSTVLFDVMTIADEVDSQLKQTVVGFTEPLLAK